MATNNRYFERALTDTFSVYCGTVCQTKMRTQACSSSAAWSRVCRRCEWNASRDSDGTSESSDTSTDAPVEDPPTNSVTRINEQCDGIQSRQHEEDESASLTNSDKNRMHKIQLIDELSSNIKL